MTTEAPVIEGVPCRTECGSVLKNEDGERLHWVRWCPNNPEAEKLNQDAVRKARESSEAGMKAPRSKRGLARRGFATRVPTPLEQIRPRPGGLTGGPAAYFIRPDGATIREALIIYPNGAPVISRNGRDRANSVYNRNRQEQKGYIYIGPTLSEDGVKQLVEVIARNRDDYILDLEEQIRDTEADIEESDRPEVRDNQRKRRVQLIKQLEIAKQPLDADKMYQELKEIAQAQKLASVAPGLREVIASIAGDVANQKLLALADSMRGGKSMTAGDGTPITVRNASEEDDF